MILNLALLRYASKDSTTRSSEDLEDVKKKILEIRDEMENSDFKCSHGFFCQRKCEYSNVMQQ